MKNRSMLVGALAIGCWMWSAAACTRVPHIITPETRGVDDVRLTALLTAHALPAGQNVSALPVGCTDALSYHLVQIRDREQPHIHATHDLAVTLLEGKGQLYVDGQPQEMRSGDVAVVPHGTPHYFVNTDGAPAAAFVIFAPPYDGTDQIPITPGP
jgi:mannose-6-phosphate isomerase-like protein (cupin superfamily)